MSRNFLTRQYAKTFLSCGSSWTWAVDKKKLDEKHTIFLWGLQSSPFCSLYLLGSIVEPQPEPQLFALAEPEPDLDQDPAKTGIKMSI